MAFWKKKDVDPWDIDPEKRKRSSAVLWEQDVPQTEPLAQEESAGPKGAEEGRITLEERIRRIVEGPQDLPAGPAEVCPWCGGEMAAVSIYARGGFVCWRKGSPGRWTDDDNVLQDPGQSFWDIPSKGAWYCEACEKMTLDVKKPPSADMPVDPNSFADYARQWKEMEEREKEQRRRKED